MIPNQVVLSVLGCQDLLAAEVGTEYVFVVFGVEPANPLYQFLYHFQEKSL